MDSEYKNIDPRVYLKWRDLISLIPDAKPNSAKKVWKHIYEENLEDRVEGLKELNGHPDNWKPFFLLSDEEWEFAQRDKGDFYGTEVYSPIMVPVLIRMFEQGLIVQKHKSSSKNLSKLREYGNSYAELKIQSDALKREDDARKMKLEADVNRLELLTDRPEDAAEEEISSDAFIFKYRNYIKQSTGRDIREFRLGDSLVSIEYHPPSLSRSRKTKTWHDPTITRSPYSPDADADTETVKDEIRRRLPRKDEILRIDNFEIGYSYSRHEIAKTGKVSPLINNKEWTGIVEFSNIFVLFVTLVKADDKPKSQHYLDYFDNSKFYWESQDGQDQKNEQILRIIDNSKEIVLFCRHDEKTKSTTQPFFYCGELAPESYQDNKPVKFRFHSLDYSPNISQDLQQIYNWKPPSSATSITIQNYDPLESLKKRLADMESTDAEATVKRRREQQILAEILFLGKTEESCSICHKVMPVRLLHAAHIKKRAKCTEEERTDPNIVMPLCKLGCDDLFEQGFILIDSKGRIKQNSNTLISKDLDLHLESLVELECTSFNKNTAPYFKHRHASNNKNSS